MTREEAINVLGDVRAYLASRASLENEILAGHTFTDICNAIKTLEQQPSEDCESRQAVKELFQEACEMKMYDFLGIDDLPPVTPIQKWIPVSERLPKSSGVYIVSRWFSDGEERAILVDANYYDGNGCWYNDNRINWGRDLVTNRIVAWMPLPEPYKAEMESEE